MSLDPLENRKQAEAEVEPPDPLNPDFPYKFTGFDFALFGVLFDPDQYLKEQSD